MNEPTVSGQVEYLIKKANKRLFLLINYQTNGVPRNKLKTVYTSTVRSVLEYSSNVSRNQVNQGQIIFLERVQKRCLKMICGYKNTYEELLQIAELQSLEDRRQKVFEKFANKTVGNTKYSWFPPNSASRTNRNTVISIKRRQL